MYQKKFLGIQNTLWEDSGFHPSPSFFMDVVVNKNQVAPDLCFVLTFGNFIVSILLASSQTYPTLFTEFVHLIFPFFCWLTTIGNTPWEAASMFFVARGNQDLFQFVLDYHRDRNSPARKMMECQYQNHIASFSKAVILCVYCCPGNLKIVRRSGISRWCTHVRFCNGTC